MNNEGWREGGREGEYACTCIYRDINMNDGIGGKENMHVHVYVTLCGKRYIPRKN